MSLADAWKKIKAALVAFGAGVAAVLGVLLWVFVKRKTIAAQDVRSDNKAEKAGEKEREEVLHTDPDTLVAGLSDGTRDRIKSASESAADRIIDDYLHNSGGAAGVSPGRN